MEVVKFLKHEKSLCRAIEKKILREAPHAIPQGRKFRIEIEDTKAKGSDPSVAAKILWLEERSGIDLAGHIQGLAGHSIQASFTNLGEKIEEIGRAET